MTTRVTETPLVGLSPLCTEQQIAKAMGVSAKRIQKLARDGLLPGIRIGRSWRFELESIRAWIKQGGNKQ